MNDNQQPTIHFTVAQLLEILNTLPPDLPVLVSGYENGYENFYHPKVLKLRHEPDNMYYDGQFQIAEEKDNNTFDAVVLDREVRSD